MRFLLVTSGLLGFFAQIVTAAEPDRLTEVKKLTVEYAAANKKFDDTDWPVETAPDQIRRYEAWPAWSYIPRFVRLAEAQPDDEPAFLCCLWILDRTDNAGNEDRRIFAADQKAWEILAAHPRTQRDLATFCLKAVARNGPAQEQFLRSVLDRTGFAKHWESQKAPDCCRELVSANGSKFKAESIGLFREVLANYADVELNGSVPYFRHIKKLSDKATKSLHALEHLTIGSSAPGIVGKDLHGRRLDLTAYRGRVVVLSFWFTGCGPCMGMIPQEQRLVKKYAGRPFALLSICGDESRETANKTAAEHKMEWPCWFDGANGPIAREWNVLGWPTIYILNEKGVVVAKQLRNDALDTKLAELMDKKR
jgi:thiol-disulfide isomerase/thioredoxin